jgi:hypothetical protein
MSTRRERRKKKLILIFISCIVFGVGYYILNVVSKIYEVRLGITFHVILGCTLMAISGIYICYTIKQLFFTKKRKRSKRIYLEDNSHKTSK